MTELETCSRFHGREELASMHTVESEFKLNLKSKCYLEK